MGLERGAAEPKNEKNHDPNQKTEDIIYRHRNIPAAEVGNARKDIAW